MRAILLSALASLVLAAPAVADIVDLRARVDDDQGQIWIAFDDQPTALAAEITETGLTLRVEGVTLRARAISPASDALVAAVSVDPDTRGGAIHLYASRSWTGARAELRQGGVLVRMQVGPAPQVHVAAEAYASDATASRADDAHAAAAPASGPADHALPETPVTDHAAADHAGSGPAASVPAEPGHGAPAHASAPTPLFAASDASASNARASGNAAVVPPGVCSAETAAVTANPWDDELLHAQAACLSGDGHLEAAASIYEQMLAFEPENFRATVALAEIRVEQGDTSAARALYDAAAVHAISDAEAARARSRLRALREN